MCAFFSLRFSFVSRLFTTLPAFLLFYAPSISQSLHIYSNIAMDIFPDFLEHSDGDFFSQQSPDHYLITEVVIKVRRLYNNSNDYDKKMLYNPDDAAPSWLPAALRGTAQIIYVDYNATDNSSITTNSTTVGNPSIYDAVAGRSLSFTKQLTPKASDRPGIIRDPNLPAFAVNPGSACDRCFRRKKSCRRFLNDDGIPTCVICSHSRAVGGSRCCSFDGVDLRDWFREFVRRVDISDPRATAKSYFDNWLSVEPVVKGRVKKPPPQKKVVKAKVQKRKRVDIHDMPPDTPISPDGDDDYLPSPPPAKRTKIANSQSDDSSSVEQDAPDVPPPTNTSVNSTDSSHGGNEDHTATTPDDFGRDQAEYMALLNMLTTEIPILDTDIEPSQ